MAKKSAFEKFSENLIEGEPLQLRRNSELATPEGNAGQEEKAGTGTKAGKKKSPDRPAAVKAGNKPAKAGRETKAGGPGEGSEELIQVTVRVPKSYKRKLEEMKYKLETSIRELFEEAVDDLGAKYEKQLKG